MDGHVLGFVAVAVVLVVAPGADFAVVLRNALAGRAQGYAASLGTTIGFIIHSGAAILGLSAILAASALAFNIFKVAGACYLCWLGARALYRSRTVTVAPTMTSMGTCAVPNRARAFKQGLLTNVLNPKAALICVSLLPQFVPAGTATLPRTALLSAILVAITAVWYTILTTAVARLQTALLRERVHRAVDRVTGTVLVGLGLRLLLTSRPQPG